MTDEEGNLDWSKLDDLYVTMGKTVRYSQPMYGSFSLLDDDDEEQAQATHSQRVRRPRGPAALETKPQHLTQTAKTDGRTKLQFIMGIITQVCHFCVSVNMLFPATLSLRTATNSYRFFSTGLPGARKYAVAIFRGHHRSR